MKLRFLGTGTSFGIPVIGCRCETCSSADPRDRRTRHAALLESDDGRRRLLVDTPPELRLQLVDAAVDRVDAVWFTHCHADHVHGLDDLRAFSVRRDSPLPAFADEACAAVLRRRFDYIFDPSYRPPDGTTKPHIELATFRPGERINAGGFDLLPLSVDHGPDRAFGFRVGDLGYITDAKRLPAATRDALAGVRVLVINALWFGRPHPTHFTVEEAVAVALGIGAERTFLVHLTHRVRHAELAAALPPSVEPAHDGLVITI